jgi:ATP-dependent Lhr-like helicase
MDRAAARARTEFALLPEIFARWFAGRGWTPRAHQLELLARAKAGRSALLIAPTGGGKTLAGFLPTLVELYERNLIRTSPRAQRAPSPLAGEGWGGG